MEAATKRASHDSIFLELTRSICPVCRQLLEAEVLSRAGKVYLRKRCPQHGEFEALVYGDAKRYLEIQRYNKPGERPLRLQTEAVEGCPRDCGICPEHKQHACLGIIEVNTGCNLDCPICFADSGTGHQPDGYSLSLEQVKRMLDASWRRRESRRRSSSPAASRPSTRRSSTCWQRPKRAASSW
jgi:uncharacterized radical SAM superfamily Fe-S cluster-containing enzyme